MRTYKSWQLSNIILMKSHLFFFWINAALYGFVVCTKQPIWLYGVVPSCTARRSRLVTYGGWEIVGCYHQCHPHSPIYFPAYPAYPHLWWSSWWGTEGEMWGKGWLKVSLFWKALFPLCWQIWPEDNKNSFQLDFNGRKLFLWMCAVNSVIYIHCLKY